MLTTLTALVGLPLVLLGAASSAFPLRNDPSGRFTRRTINSTSAAASYDFVIVGGGTAGLVLANRLTETNLTVLVLEDGTSPSEVNAYQAPGANQQVLGGLPGYPIAGCSDDVGLFFVLKSYVASRVFD